MLLSAGADCCARTCSVSCFLRDPSTNDFCGGRVASVLCRKFSFAVQTSNQIVIVNKVVTVVVHVVVLAAAAEGGEHSLIYVRIITADECMCK